MFIIITKETNFSAIIKEKIALSDYISISVSTITRKQHLKMWETDKYIIYNVSFLKLKSKRGGKRNKMTCYD